MNMPRLFSALTALLSGDLLAEMLRLLKALEYGYRRYEIIQEWRELVEKLKSVAREVLGPDTRVCVFGSVVRGRYTAASDVDALIVAESAQRLEVSSGAEDSSRRGSGDRVPRSQPSRDPLGEESWYLEDFG